MSTQMGLITSVVEHDNRVHLLNGILNKTNSWFYQALSHIYPDADIAGLKDNLSNAMTNYLSTLYRISRRAGITTQPYEKFFYDNSDTAQSAMIYLLKSLRVLCGPYYASALAALWVELERRETEYAEYARTNAGREEYDQEMMFRFVCYAVDRQESSANLN
ncbi:MAG TPA: hypothetical protein P5244_04930 [Syntrophales bacterium]|nr:hypothetical protein [Syntrophales bacterium]